MTFVTTDSVSFLGETNSGKSAINDILAGRTASPEGCMPTTGINTDMVIETDLITKCRPVKFLDTMGFEGTNAPDLQFVPPQFVRQNMIDRRRMTVEL